MTGSWTLPTVEDIQRQKEEERKSLLSNFDSLTSRMGERSKLLQRLTEKPKTKAEELGDRLEHENTIVWEPIPNSSQSFAIATRAHHTLMHGARGPGKDISVNTLVLTDSGWKKAGDVNLTDMLVSSDGSYTKLLGIYPQGYKTNLYLVTFDDGCQVVAGADHLWTVGNNKRFKREGYKVHTTKWLYEAPSQWGVPYLSSPADGKKWEGFDPYAIGLMLGDGTMGSQYPTLYSQDEEIVAYMEVAHDWKVYKYDLYRAVATKKSQWKALRELWPNKEKAEFKSVPRDLMVADPASRLAVLQGLMDTDGSIEKNGNKCRFVSLSKQLAEDVAELVRSLGGKAHCYFENRPSPKGGKDHRWRVNFNCRDKFIPFRLTRKWERCQTTNRVQNLRYIKSIAPTFPDHTVCFSVAHPSKLFVVQGHVLTHNTITQLMRFRSRVGLGYGAYWRGVIFDREFKNLSDLVAQSLRFFPKFEDGCKWLKSATEFKWTWPTGEELLFRHVKKSEDYDTFHGHEYPFIGWNELTKHPTSEVYDKFMSVNRSSFDREKHTPIIKTKDGYRYNTPDGEPLPPITLEVFSTTNPNGPGHNWVKKRFIDVAKNGEVVKKEVKYFDTLKGEEVTVVRTQVAIFGSFYENPYLDPIYRAGLIESCANNPNLKAAWIDGRWDANSGGAIDDLWNSEIHIVDRFRIPKAWKVDRTFDWGSSHPFCTVFWAEANGEEVKMPDGTTWCPARGSLIAIEEDYGSEAIGTNKGLKLSAKDVALRIVAKERALLSEQWIVRGVQAGPADNQIDNVTESDVDTIAFKMKQHGIAWTKSDKSAGSRIIGLQLMRDRLQSSVTKEGPAIYFMRNCVNAIDLLPSLPRDPDKPDDVDCWVAGTMIATPNGDVPIEFIRKGDFVSTPIGPRRVTKSYVSGRAATTQVFLSNGVLSEGTNDHKIFVEGAGLVPLSLLYHGLPLTLGVSECQNTLSMTEFFTRDGATAITIRQTEPSLLTAELACIDRFGLTTKDQFQRDFISTILTTIQTTITLKTCVWSRLRNTLDIIWLYVASQGNLPLLAKLGWTMGGGKFFARMLKRCVKTHPKGNLRALIVLAKLEQNIRLNSIAKSAQLKETQKGIIQNPALCVGKSSSTKHIQENKLSLVVRNVVGCYEKKQVYNITVEQAGLFYANGLLSSNTEAEDHYWDAVRYRVLKGSNKWATKIKTNFVR